MIAKTLGALLFLYYTYLEQLHTRPKDMEDLVDGLLYLDAKGLLEKNARATEHSARRTS